MKNAFSRILKQKRKEKGISQEMLAQKLFVTKAAVSYWENGSRIPDNKTIIQIAECLDIDVAMLLNAVADNEDSHNIIIVDDSKPILKGGMSVLKEVLPNANIVGFSVPHKAVEYAKENKIFLAVLDIELGAASGLDLCDKLLEINLNTNVIYLTAYPDYSLDAWKTGACGFMVKPLTPDKVREQLVKMRYPFLGGTAE